MDWLGRPPAYCNTTDKELLGKILPAFDQETLNFYRWQVTIHRQDLEEIIRKKSGIDFGKLQNLIPLERGPSGRIYKLKIEGSKTNSYCRQGIGNPPLAFGKPSFKQRFCCFRHEQWHDGTMESFIFHGGGWGHGVGLCQIGAAVMASKGFSGGNSGALFHRREVDRNCMNMTSGSSTKNWKTQAKNS